MLGAVGSVRCFFPAQVYRASVKPENKGLYSEGTVPTGDGPLRIKPLIFRLYRRSLARAGPRRHLCRRIGKAGVASVQRPCCGVRHGREGSTERAQPKRWQPHRSLQSLHGLVRVIATSRAETVQQISWWGATCLGGFGRVPFRRSSRRRSANAGSRRLHAIRWTVANGASIPFAQGNAEKLLRKSGTFSPGGTVPSWGRYPLEGGCPISSAAFRSAVDLDRRKGTGQTQPTESRPG